MTQSQWEQCHTHSWLYIKEGSRLFQAIAIDTPVYMALDHDAEKKAEWIIKSMLKYDVQVHKVPIDEADVSEMGGEEFQERLLSSRQIKNDSISLNKCWRIYE